jgi:predicted transglutaminase-like cysteine proteinase
LKGLLLCLVCLSLISSGCAVPGDDGVPVPSLVPPQQPEVQSPETTAIPEQVSGLGRGMPEMPNVNVTQAYIIESQRWGEIVWTLEIPTERYFYYREKLRPWLYGDYVKMAADPQDDVIIDAVIAKVNKTAAEKGIDRTGQLSLVLDFVQSIQYSDDVVTTGRNEYPRYPVETLFEKQGDCEDTSILAAAILSKMGYDVALLLFEKFDHMGVGVNDASIEYGNSWIVDGKRYWYFDTTGGRSVGWTPDEYAKTAAYILPVKN